MLAINSKEKKCNTPQTINRRYQEMQTGYSWGGEHTAAWTPNTAADLALCCLWSEDGLHIFQWLKPNLNKSIGVCGSVWSSSFTVCGWSFPGIRPRAFVHFAVTNNPSLPLHCKDKLKFGVQAKSICCLAPCCKSPPLSDLHGFISAVARVSLIEMIINLAWFFLPMADTFLDDIR